MRLESAAGARVEVGLGKGEKDFEVYVGAGGSRRRRGRVECAVTGLRATVNAAVQSQRVLKIKRYLGRDS